jgi:hypothetical protein
MNHTDNTPPAPTAKEWGILSIIRMNRAERKREIHKTWRVGRLEIHFHWQSSSCFWGRFGGGWQWVVGFEASRGFRTMILNAGISAILEGLIRGTARRSANIRMSPSS